MKARNDLFGAALWLLGRAIEIVVFERWTSLSRSALDVALQEHLTAIRPAFDASLYVRQFNDVRRRRVSLAPLLHYVLLGWREGRAPSAAFDPHYFVRRNPTLPRNVDPLLLHAGLGDVREACHELVGSMPGSEADIRRTVLTIHHARGGGSSTFLDLYEANLRREGYGVLRLRALAGATRLGSVHRRGEARGPVFDLDSELPQLAEHCRVHDVSSIVVNHVIDRPADVLEWIPALARLVRCDYEVILHDYFALCPRVNMVTGNGRFCATAPPTVCARCTADCGSDVEKLHVHEWRPRFASFLSQAAKITVPSGDAARRLAPLLQSIRLTVWEPEDDSALPEERLPVLTEDQPLRILCIGALSVPKGAYVLQALAREASIHHGPFVFTVIGDGINAKALIQAGVRVTGYYKSEDIDRLIEQADPHVVFLPSIWPETWSFVLSAAFRRGLPVVAFDLGAPAERLRRLSRGHLLPIDMAWRPADLLAAFQKLRNRWITI